MNDLLMRKAKDACEGAEEGKTRAADEVPPAEGRNFESARCGFSSRSQDCTRITTPTFAGKEVRVAEQKRARLLAEVHMSLDIMTMMKPLGTIAAYGSVKNMTPELPFGPYLFKGLKLDITLIYILPDAPRAEAIERLHAALADGALKPDVEHVLPLEKAAEAQDIVLEPGRAGAVLLELG